MILKLTELSGDPILVNLPDNETYYISQGDNGVHIVFTDNFRVKYIKESVEEIWEIIKEFKDEQRGVFNEKEEG